MHEISLTIERLPEAQEKECRITSPRQIHAFLRGISESGSRVALYYDGTKNFIMTSLLAVGEKGLWVEQGMDAPANRQIAASKKITFVSTLNQVKIQFAVGGTRAVDHRGYQAFYLPLPANLYRIQRREYFRLAIPHSERVRCIIPANEQDGREQLELPVLDISGGGLRFSCSDEGVEFVLGQIYAGCLVDLPEVGRIEVTLRVKNVNSSSLKQGQVVTRVGCEFREIDNSASVLLQRYVTNMQLQKKDL